MSLRPKSFFELCCGIAALATAVLVLTAAACQVAREFLR